MIDFQAYEHASNSEVDDGEDVLENVNRGYNFRAQLDRYNAREIDNQIKQEISLDVRSHAEHHKAILHLTELSDILDLIKARQQVTVVFTNFSSNTCQKLNKKLKEQNYDTLCFVECDIMFNWNIDSIMNHF